MSPLEIFFKKKKKKNQEFAGDGLCLYGGGASVKER